MFKLEADGELLIKVDNVVVAFGVDKGQRFTQPLRIGTYPFQRKANPLNSADSYYLFDARPPLYVNVAVVTNQPSEVCSVNIFSLKESKVLAK